MIEKSTILLIFISLLFLASCTQPNSPSVSETGLDPASSGVDLTITSAVGNTIPVLCAIGSGKTADFTVTVKNNGRSIAESSELVLVYVLVTGQPDMTYDDLLHPENFKPVTSKSLTLGFAKEQFQDFIFDPVDISTGVQGDYYFYAFVMSTNKNYLPINDDNPIDNVVSLNNSTPCQKFSPSHTSWPASATPLAGGKSFGSAVQVPSFGQWYSGNLASTFECYSIQVSTGSIYDIYWDSASEGSGNYDGSITAVFIYHTDASPYGISGNQGGYFIPLSVTAEEDTILIVILGNGSYAFGIGMR